ARWRPCGERRGRPVAAATERLTTAAVRAARRMSRATRSSELAQIAARRDSGIDEIVGEPPGVAPVDAEPCRDPEEVLARCTVGGALVRDSIRVLHLLRQQ